MTLSEYLKKHGLSNDAFGQEIGVSGAAVSRYATKKRFPEAEIMQRIIYKTNAEVTANEWFNIPEPPHRSQHIENQGGT